MSVLERVSGLFMFLEAQDHHGCLKGCEESGSRGGNLNRIECSVALGR